MRLLSETWPEALLFFEGIIRLHDAEIEGLEASESKQEWLLILREVSKCSDSGCFFTAYETLIIEFRGLQTVDLEAVAIHRGYDIIDARLSPGLFWCNTLMGDLYFDFASIRFLAPD